MARSIKQMLPLLTILALAGYCCWSEEDSTPPKSSGKGAKNSSSPEITQALLTPSSAPVPVRNPFQNPSVDPSKTKKALATAAKKGDLLAAKSDLEKQLNLLVLRATFIQGERRLAMINDRFYGEGDLLPHPTPISPPLLGKGPSIEVAKTDLPSWRIVTVFPDKVAACQDQTTELKFRPPEKRTRSLSPTLAEASQRKPRTVEGKP